MVSVAQAFKGLRRSHRVRDDGDEQVESSSAEQQLSNSRHSSSRGGLQSSSSFSKVIGASKAKQKAAVPNPRKNNTKQQQQQRSSSKGPSTRRSRSSPPPRSSSGRAVLQSDKSKPRRRGRSANNSVGKSVGTEKTAHLTVDDSPSHNNDDDDNDSVVSSANSSVASGGSSSSSDSSNSSCSSSSSEESGTVYSELDASTMNGSSTTKPNNSKGVTAKKGVTKNTKPASGRPIRPPPRQQAISKEEKQQQPNNADNDGMVESMKMKPPSVLGTKIQHNKKKHKKQNRRRSNSDDQLNKSATNHHGSSARSVQSAGDLSVSRHSVASSISAEQSVQENMAMQQLAYLVVQLRSDLREATVAKEEAEEKLDQAQQHIQNASTGGDNAKMRQLLQENADLQADIDVFIAEQEDLQKEIELLKEEKVAANDVIKLMKKGSTMGGSVGSTGSSATASLETKVEALESRVKELTDENHKLEKQIQLLVDEKQSFVCRDEEINTLKKSLQEKEGENETMISELQAQISELEKAKSEIEKVANDQKMEVAIIEDQMEAREKEFETEAKKMTLVRQRLSQVEKQKVELSLKNESLELQIQTLKQEEASSKAVGISSDGSSKETVHELEEKISSLENTKSQLEDELSTMKAQAKDDAIKLTEMESKVKVLQELSDYEGEEAELKARVADLTAANEGMKHQIHELEAEQGDLSEEMEKVKNESSRTINELEVSLKAKQTSLQSVLTTKSNLESQQLVSVDTITSLSKKISDLEEAKEGLETELAESADAITMLEDELDAKDAELNAALDRTTNVQQQFSTKDSHNSALTERNETLIKQIEELNTQVKVLIVEKTVANEEIEALKQSRSVEKSSSELEKKLARMEESTQEMQKELDESCDAILMLKEALAELEDEKVVSDAKIEELEAELESSLIAAKHAETSSNQRESEHQIHVDTISALQKMIQSLETSKEELEEELNQSSMALHDMKEDIRTKDSVLLVKELEGKLADLKEENAKLSERIVELTNENETVESQVKDLGESVFSLTRRNSTDGLATCDALIVELKSEIKDLVRERNAALDQVKALQTDNTFVDANVPKPAEPTGEKVASASSVCAQDPPMKIMKPSEQPKPTRERSNLSSAVSTASTKGTTPSRGSSLLEAAKKLCNKLDEQRGVSYNEFETENQDPEDYQDDASSAKELKEEPVESPVEVQANNNLMTPKLDGEKNRSARSQRKYDIDQLTSIYFERCGSEGGSKLSDLSSEGRSARRIPERKEGITTKKVKICRNGVFMGTYEGDLNQDGQRHGFGVLICDNGNSYEGEWKRDKRDGLGIARYSSGDVYDGEWTKGKRQGHGVMYIEAGDTYIGSWNNGLKHGAGTYHWADGEVDVSWYQEDRRVGEGVRWNSTRSKAYRLVRGTKKEEISLDEAYNTAEKLGLNLEKVDSSVSS